MIIANVIKIYDLLGHKKETEIRVFGNHYKTGKSIFVNNKDEFIHIVSKYDSDMGVSGVYVGMNERTKGGKKKKDVITCKYYLIDLDDIKEGDDKELEKILIKHNLKYCLKTFSGHGFHYWFPILIIEGNEKIIAFLEQKATKALIIEYSLQLLFDFLIFLIKRLYHVL